MEVDPAVVDPSVDLLRLLDEDDGFDGLPSVAAGAGVDPGVAVALDAARCELAVVALVGHRPRNVLEEIYLCSAGDFDVELGMLQCFYQPQDQILFLCLDTSSRDDAGAAGAEDWEHLLKSGQLEVRKLEALLLLFSLCHVVTWFCPGSSPRLDTAALKLLVKVQEFQGHCDLTSTAPLVIFVHRQLKLPAAAKQRAALEALEKVLDNRWRNSLKRLKLLQDAKRSMSVKGLFRVNRPCSVAMEREVQRDPQDLANAVEDPSTAVDRLRSRLVEAVKDAKRERLSFQDWLRTASALHLRLHTMLSAAARLPEELALALNQDPNPTSARGPGPGPGPLGPSGPSGSPEMCWSLGSWAFPELFFAFNSAQEAVDEGCRIFSSSLSTSPTDPQDLLRGALQLVRQKTYAPLVDYAVRLCQRHCERMAQRAQPHGRPCKFRGSSGRPCALQEGHKEPHRNNFRPCKVCLCGKSQVQVTETFDPPKVTKDGLPPFGACCHNVQFLPFLPDICDFDDPVLIPPSPRLAKVQRGGAALAALPSALPEANGFVALVADAPMPLDPLEGARLPGFGDQLMHLSRWRLPGPVAGPSSLDVYVGFEYLCPLGHRFFAPPPKYSGLESEGKRRGRRKEQGPSLDEGDLQSIPLCGYRLYVFCVQHRRHKGRNRSDPPCVAQLMRIWVQTPRRREVIEAEPRVQMVDVKGEAGPDGRAPEVVMTGGKVVLPPGMLVQLVLPSAYYRASGDLPSFWELSSEAVDRCRLLPYLLTLRPPS